MHGETLEPLVYLASKLRSLEGKLTLAQAKKLVALPAELGFSSTDEFLAAFRSAISAHGNVSANEAVDATFTSVEPESILVSNRRASNASSDTEAVSEEANAAVAVSAGPEPRSVEIDLEVKKLIDAGKSRAQIARELGITERKVQSIKKSLGLVRKRSAKVKKSKSARPRSSRKSGSSKGG